MAAGAVAPSGSGPSARLVTRLVNRRLTSAPASDPYDLAAAKLAGAVMTAMALGPDTCARRSAPSPIPDRRRLYVPLPVRPDRPRAAGAAPLVPRPGNQRSHAPAKPLPG